MLSVGKLAPGQGDYYLRTVARGAEDYYLFSGEAPGRWIGGGCGVLGLKGQVESDPFLAVLAGADPRTGDYLGRRWDACKQPGFDLTFSAPKSVSLMFALADTETSARMREAHDRAVEAALGYLERTAGHGRRGRGGVNRIATDGFVGAAFRHRTSRAGDPNLHTHVIVANKVRGVDGRWSALDGKAIYHQAKTAGTLYQSHLRHELRDLGLTWTVARTGVGEINGVRQDVRRAFSRRRQEIEARLEERHQTSPRAAQIATLETRTAKQYDVDERTLLDEWRERANGLGFTPACVADLLEAGRERALMAEAPSAPTEYLLSPAGLTAHASTFGERDVLQAYARSVPDGAPVATVCRWSEELIEGPDLLRLPTPGVRRRSDVLFVRQRATVSRLVPLGASEGRFTTPDMLAVEQQLITSATSRRGTRTGEALERSVSKALAARPYLSDEQVAMVRELTSAGHGVSAINAMAGAGKTTAMAAAAEAWTESGYRVVGACLSAKAASVLREGAGVPAFTLAQVLNEVRHPEFRGFPANTVLVVDEAGQAGSRTLHELEGHLSRNGCKLVIIGDVHQLPEIDAGGAFRGLVDRMPSVELSRNQRQVDPREREWLGELRNGDVALAVRGYAEAGRVVVGSEPDDLRDRLVSDWLEAWRLAEEPRRPAVAMLAVTNVDVEDLNFRARRTGLMTASKRAEL